MGKISLYLCAILATATAGCGGQTSPAPKDSQNTVTLSEAELDARIRQAVAADRIAQEAEVLVADNNAAETPQSPPAAVRTPNNKKSERRNAVARQETVQDIPPDPFADLPIVDDYARRQQQCNNGATKGMANGDCAN